MNIRREKILSLMKSRDQWITSKVLARLFGVSDRTIRTDVEAINNELGSIVIESAQHKGYHYTGDDYDSAVLPVKKSSTQIPETPKEREIYIINQLLITRDALNITDLVEQMYISEYTFENDLKRARDIVSCFANLSIARDSNHIQLKGSEQSIRQLYNKMMMEEASQNLLNINEIAAMYKDFSLLKCKYEFEKILARHNYSVDDFSMPSLMLHIGISMNRIINGKYADTERNTEAVRKSEEYKIAYEFYECMASLYQTQVVESETVLLALLLLGKRGAVYSDEKMNEIAPGIQCDNVVKGLIQNVLQMYNIDFTNDDVLQVGLTVHLQSLIERSRKNQVAANLYLQEIKRKYPLIFEMGVTCANYLSDALRIKIEEDEIGFIALHLGMAYERLNTNSKFRAVLIMPETQAITNQPGKKIEYQFSEYMQIIKSFNYFEESKVMEECPDLIICTIPINHRLPIPTIQVSVFISREDEGKIFTALNKLDKERFKKEYSQYLRSMIRKEHFYCQLDCSTPEQVIKHLSDDLYQSFAISKEFYNSVMKREEMSPTSFSFGLAVPHPMDHSVLQSNISVAILKRPIHWGTNEVQVVFLLAIEDTDRNAIRPFYDWITTLSNSTEEFSELLGCRDYSDFIKHIQ